MLPSARLMTPEPYTVLIVDDEAPLRRVLERLLSREGYRVVSAGSGETAYDLLVTEQPKALLLDIHLPTMSGPARGHRTTTRCTTCENTARSRRGTCATSRHWWAPSSTRRRSRRSMRRPRPSPVSGRSASM